MKYINYFFQFIITILFFFIFKVLGPSLSSKLSGKIFEIIGPMFRSRKIIHSNIKRAFPKIEAKNLHKLTNKMWNNYGKVFAEFMFIKKFRSGELSNKIEIEGKHILDEIILSGKQVIFISGHFSNFELMAMSLEKYGIKLSIIYRPLNNIFLNRIMERMREKYICKNQIKKGKSGTRNLIDFIKKKFSVALMIDQRVSEGESINFFNNPAKTTTIPAQLVKKYNCRIVPVYIERINKHNFKISFKNPIKFDDRYSTKEISLELNKILEKMIIANAKHWIWTHNRWKI